MSTKIKVTLFNENGTPRWELLIKRFKGKPSEGDTFKVEEDTKYSLFDSDSWEPGNTPGQALDNFLKVEKELIDNL